jgi:hypothetical protein
MPTDNFNRANGALGANWTDLVAGYTVVSNQASNSINSAVACSKYSASSPSGNDMSAKIAYVTQGVANTQQPGPCVRLTGTNAGNMSAYWLFLNTDGATADKSWSLQKGNGFTPILTGTDSMVAADVWEVRAVGTTISVYKNAVLVNSVVDATIGSGTWGIMGYNAAVGPTPLDDWTGTDLSVPGSFPFRRKSRIVVPAFYPR